MKKLLYLLLLLPALLYGQQQNTTNTKFTNGLQAPNGTPPKPTTGLTAGALNFTTGVGMQYYDGSQWVTLGASGGGVTSFNGRTGAVVPLIGDYASFYVPLTRTVAGFALSSDVTLASLTAGTGIILTGGYNGSSAKSILVDQSFSPTWTGTHTFSNVILGTARQANKLLIAFNDNSTNTTVYPIWSRVTSGYDSLGISSTKISFNPSTGALTATSFVGAVTGNASTATALQTARTIGIVTGDATSSGSSFNGTANNTNALTLATVNSNVGSFGSSTSIPTFTVNAKGLITAASGNVVIAPAGTLTGTTLASNVVTSSITTAALANLTATNTTLTFSGSYNGNTARTVGLNLGNANTWTAQQTVNTGVIGTTTPSFIAIGSSNNDGTYQLSNSNLYRIEGGSAYNGTNIYAGGTSVLTLNGLTTGIATWTGGLTINGAFTGATTITGSANASFGGATSNGEVRVSGLSGTSPRFAIGNSSGTNHWVWYETIDGSGNIGDMGIANLIAGSTPMLINKTTDGLTLSSTLGIGGTADNVKSTAFTPTTTAGSNVANITVDATDYTRVGDVVSMTISGTIQATAGSGTNTAFTITPVVASNFTTAQDARGTGQVFFASDVRGMNISSNFTTDKIDVSFPAANTSSQGFSMQITYKVK